MSRGEPNLRRAAEREPGTSITIDGPSRRLILFGDPVGLPQLLGVVDRSLVTALVGAAARPEQHGALAELARSLGVPFLVQPRRSAPELSRFDADLVGLCPDLFLINSYSMILSSRLLSIPRYGAINVHGALLPEYRGANPVEWALINGAREAGVTIHVVDEGIDTGPIVAQRKIPIAFEDTWLDVRRGVNAATDRLLAETIPPILRGGLAARAQGPGRSWRRRTPEDGRFDWNASIIAIYNLIRALVAPHPGAVAPDGQAFSAWRALPEIAWLKYPDGTRHWTDSRWRIGVCRPRPVADPRKANASLDLRFGRLHGPPVGTCRLSCLNGEGPVDARMTWRGASRIEHAEKLHLQAAITRFAQAELGREVVFAR